MDVRNGVKSFLLPLTYINITDQTFRSAFTLPYIILQTTLIGRYTTATVTVIALSAYYVLGTVRIVILCVNSMVLTFLKANHCFARNKFYIIADMYVPCI